MAVERIILGHERRIVDYVCDQYKDLRSDRSDMEDTWLECMEAYLSKFNKSWTTEAANKKRSKRYLALTWDAVENNVAQFEAMVFPNNDWFRLEPGRIGGFNEKDDRSAPSVQHMMKWQHRMAHYHRQFIMLLKWLNIVGNASWTQTWHKEYAADYPAYAQAMAQWVEEQRIAWGEYQQAMMEYQRTAEVAARANLPPPPPPPIEMPDRPAGNTDVAYEGPRLIVGDIFNFVIDTQANNPHTAFRASKFWRSKAHLMRFAQPDESGYAVYENLQNVKNAQRRTDEDGDKENLIANTFGMQIPDKQQVDLIEACGDFEIAAPDTSGESTIFRNYVATVANKRTLIRFEPSHLWSGIPHQQLSTLIPVPNQTYGVGLVEMALGTQDAINARSNQIIDAAAYAINPEVKAVDDGVLDPDDSKSGPGSIVWVGTMDNAEPMHKNFSGIQLGMQEVGMMKGEFQQISRSANPFTTQHYKKSATEIARDATVSGASLKHIANFFETETLIPILTMQLQLNQQYINEEVAIEVNQDDKTEILRAGPQAIRQSWLVRVVGSQNITEKEKRINDLLMFYQLTAGNPVTAPQVDMRYLMQRILEEMGIQDADKILADEQTMMMQMMMMGGMDGQGEESDGGNGGAGAEGSAGAEAPPGANPLASGVAPFIGRTKLS